MIRPVFRKSNYSEWVTVDRDQLSIWSLFTPHSHGRLCYPASDFRHSRHQLSDLFQFEYSSVAVDILIIRHSIEKWRVSILIKDVEDRSNVAEQTQPMVFERANFTNLGSIGLFRDNKSDI